MALILRLLSMAFVITVGESMFSSSEMGDGKARRRKNSDCESAVDVRILGCGIAADVGGAVTGDAKLESDGVSIDVKCPYIGVGIRAA